MELAAALQATFASVQTQLEAQSLSSFPHNTLEHLKGRHISPILEMVDDALSQGDEDQIADLHGKELP
jgi:hypothetical protein